jgi:hypothetical protein
MVGWLNHEWCDESFTKKGVAGAQTNTLKKKKIRGKYGEEMVCAN